MSDKPKELPAPEDRESVTIDLLEELGIIEDAQASELRKGHHRSLKDILLQEVSFGSLKDFFTYELPFSRNTKQQQLRRVLHEEGILSIDRIEKELQPLEGFDENLERYLLRRQEATAAEIEEARRRSEEGGTPLWRTMLNMSLISPKVLADFAHTYQSGGAGTDSETQEFLAELLHQEAISQELAEQLESENIPIHDLIDVLLRNEVNPETIGGILEKNYTIGMISARDVDADSETAIYSIPDSFVIRNRAIPISKGDRTLRVAMVNPLDNPAKKQMRMITGLEPSAQYVLPSDFQRLYDRYYASRVKDSGFLDGKSGDALKDSSAVQLVASIIEGGIKARASDIHFETNADGLRVRYRIDGMLYDVATISSNQTGPVIARIKILAEMDITDRRRPHDGHFAITMPDNRFDLRISSIPTYHGEKIVIRILDSNKVIRGIQQLGLTNEEVKKMEGLVHRPHGMILATGPMGSGKTTTLYAILNELDILHQNIVTIENPVEYHLPGITQVQVSPETGLDFAVGLRSLLRQDADVIMVGEIRDPDTAHVAIWAALTGHQVLSTLHTNDTAGAVTMLSNLNIPRYLIGGAINGVLSSRLVRRLCRHCKETFEPDNVFLKYHRIEELKGKKLYRAVGCRHCNFIGFQGMTGVYEIMEISDDLRLAIVDNADEAAIESLSRKEGMSTLYENGLRKVLAGETTVDEIERKIMR